DGLLATVIPGSFDGWMLMLRDYVSMSVRDVLEPAIYYAEHGHPMLRARCRPAARSHRRSAIPYRRRRRAP
ncbi:gamma-glutamyltransferase, partial [Rhizobium leguminosarum]|uniref:gamma-glutamyltransferase n=1 Tax=Rhizobium leguminosarum TaxID=384 RepID=UPI003F9A5F2E